MSDPNPPPTPDMDLPVIDMEVRYAALPEQTTFVESACYNAVFDEERVYIPVSAKEHPDVAGLYALRMLDHSLTRVCALPASGEYYGCAIGDDGVCYIAVGNQGTIMAIDLCDEQPTARTLATLPDGYQPNDVAVHAQRRRVLVAANHQPHDLATERGQILNSLHIVATGGGALFEVPTQGKGGAQVVLSGLRVLAGIATCHGEAWLSELTNLVRVPLHAPASFTRHHPFDPRLFADNLCARGDRVWFPFYRVVSESMARPLQQPLVSRGLYWLLRLFAPHSFFGEPGAEGDEMPNVCYGAFDVRTEQLHAYRFPPDNAAFDGHCTHVEPVGEQLVFINYLKREVLIATPAD